MFFAETVLPPDNRVRVVRDAAELPYWEGVLRDAGKRAQLSWDTETSGFDWWREARPIGHCFGYNPNDGYGPRGIYLPYRHRTADKQLPEQAVVDFAQSILGDPSLQIHTHFGKFDAHQAEAEGIEIKAFLHMTEVMVGLVDENHEKQLEHAALTWFKEGGDPYFYKKLLQDTFREDCKRRGLKQKQAPGYAYLPVEICGRYGANDARNTLGVGERLLPQVQASWAESYATETAILPIITRAERIGLKIDVGYLHELHAKCLVRIEEIQHEIRRLAGYDINPSSDTEVRELIYGRLAQPIRFYTDTIAYGPHGEEIRTPSCDATALRDIIYRTGSQLVRKLLDFRDVDKLRSTYTTPLIDHTDERGYLHGRLEQSGTVTWRFSSKDPNLQNMPSDDKDGIRRAFLVPEGKIRVFLDFSQIELRVLAWESKEPTMFAAFVNGEDVHAATSIRMFGKADKSNRRVAKVINFGVAYGMTMYGVRDNLNKNADPEKGIPTVDDEQAKAYLEQWHKLFPRVSTWINEFCLDMLRHHVPQYRNIFGRTRRVPDLRASGSAGRRAIRQAVASRIQGGAAEMTKICLLRIEGICAAARAMGWQADIVNTIHDEIQVDIDRAGAQWFVPLAKQAMEHFPQLAPMPIVVEAEWSATNWGDKVPVYEKA